MKGLKEFRTPLHCDDASTAVEMCFSRSVRSLILGVSLLSAFILGSCNKTDEISPIPPPQEDPSTPEFAITSVARGAMLSEGTMEDVSITIDGEACDSVNAVTGVKVNTAAVALEGSGDCKTFTAQVNSNWGLNIIDMIVENALGDEVPLVQSYLRSPEYFPAPETAGDARISGAWRGRLRQAALDDGSSGDFNDLASVLEAVVNGFDWNSAVPQVLLTAQINKICPIGRSGVQFRKNGALHIGAINIGVHASPGSLRVDLYVDGVSQPLTVDGYYSAGCLAETHLVKSGSVSAAAIQATVILDASYNKTLHRAEVKLQSNTINFINPSAKINVFGNELIDDQINGAITNLVAGYVQDIEVYLEDQLAEQLPQVIDEYFVGFKIEPTIDLPAPINVQLSIASALDHVEVGNGFVDLGLNARVLPSIFKKDAEQLAYGSIIGSNTLPSFNGINGTFGVAMKDDFLNQVLWAVWAGGGFDFGDGNNSQIVDLLGASNLKATILSVETGLPPVIMPGDEGSEVKLGIGDVLVKMKIDPAQIGRPGAGASVELSFYVSAILTGTVEINPTTDKISFILSKDPEVHVQLVGFVRTPASILLESKIGDFISTLLQQQITDVLGAVDMPTMTLPEVNGIPPGTRWMLADGSTDHSSGYFRVIGKVGVE